MCENVFSKSVRNSHRVSKCPRHFVTRFTSKIVHAPRTRVRTGGGVDSGRGAGRLVVRSVRCIDSYLSLASSRSESSLSPELLVTRVFMQPLLYFFAKHCKILCVSVARAFARALKSNEIYVI